MTKTILKAGIFYFYTVIMVAVVGSLQLSRITYKDIVEVAHTSCVVAIPDTLIDENVRSLLSSAVESFKNEPKVAFYFVDFSSFTTESTQSTQKKSNDLFLIDFTNSFVVYKFQRKDRSCLLTPPKSSSSLKPAAYSLQGDNDFDLSYIIDFINDKCLTFRKIDGNLTPQGIHEKYILNNNNLYSVPHKAESENDNVRNEETKDYDPSSTDSDLFCTRKLNDKEGNGCEIETDSNNEQSTLLKKYTSSNSVRINHPTDDIRHCERIPLPTSSSEFLNEYVTKSKPVVITGATSHWPVFKKWKNQYLKEKYGDIKIHIKVTPNGDYEGVESTDMWDTKSKIKIPSNVLEQLSFPDLVVVRPATMEIQFSEFINLIESIASSKSSNFSAYLEYSSISYFKGLEKDITEMSFIDGVLDLKHTNVWLSDGNTVGKLHFDPFDNFMCQISGEKEFILYDPHKNERLYEAHIQEAMLSYNVTSRQFSRHKLMESTSMVMSPVNITKPDLKRFPKFSEANPLSCKIQPGEVLFTPAFWWHEVRSKPNTTEHRNLAVNFWYDPFFMKEFPCPECRLYVNPNYFHLL